VDHETDTLKADLMEGRSILSGKYIGCIRLSRRPVAAETAEAIPVNDGDLWVGVLAARPLERPSGLASRGGSHNAVFDGPTGAVMALPFEKAEIGYLRHLPD